MGLIVVAVLVALITNGIRRRRARKFDDEIAAAARDAANVQVPNFYEDDDDYRPGYGPGGGKYSDVSHGTYGQAPLNPAPVQESYGMREMAHAPAPGEYFESGAHSIDTAAGAAGVGVARARSMRDGGYAAGLQEGASPYAAFAAPTTSTTGSQYPPGMIRAAGGPEFDVNPGINRRPSQYTQQIDYTALSRNKSVTSVEGSGPSTFYGSSAASASASAPSYPGQDPYYNQYPQQTGQTGYPNSFGAYAITSAHNPSAPISTRSEEDLNAAYGGYVDETAHRTVASPPPDSLPNPFSAKSDPRIDEYADESDEQESPKRVLKVANE